MLALLQAIALGAEMRLWRVSPRATVRLGGDGMRTRTLSEAGGAEDLVGEGGVVGIGSRSCWWRWGGRGLVRVRGGGGGVVVVDILEGSLDVGS